jgi:hypothetical protein
MAVTRDDTLQNFTVEDDRIDLPRGATARARRVKIGWRGRAITALSQGDYRSYLYPVFTPAGFPVTAEAPIDHPHHQSVTIGADHFNCFLPYSGDNVEEANYSFYVNYTFQGRAPGRIVGKTLDATEVAEDHLRIVQTLHWQGPSEWGAHGGRTVAEETRTIDIRPGEAANVIDIRSRLRPTEWDISIGPTRHAYLTVRMADGLRVVDGGTVVDSKGRSGGEAISGSHSDWVDASGTTGGARRAGVALLPYPSAGDPPWSVADYGTITVNPFLETRRDLSLGDSTDFAARLLVHDGDDDEAGVAAMFQTFLDEQQRGGKK